MWEKLEDIWDWLLSRVLENTFKIEIAWSVLLTVGVGVYGAYLVFYPDSRPEDHEDEIHRQKVTVSMLGSPGSHSVIFAPTIVQNKSRMEWVHDLVQVRDRHGKSMEIEVGMLRKVGVGMMWNPYKWVLGSTSEVGIDDKEVRNIEEAIESSPAEESRPIIAVGMASHENTDVDPDREEALAGYRAERLVDLCQRRFPGADIYSLNLGFYHGDTSSTASSASERRVVLMVITSWEEGAHLNSGVRNALIAIADEKRFSFDARNYSKFSENRFSIRQDYTRSQRRMNLSWLEWWRTRLTQHLKRTADAAA